MLFSSLFLLFLRAGLLWGQKSGGNRVFEGGVSAQQGATRFGGAGAWARRTTAHRQVSLSVYEPEAGVVICMFGSDSQVTAPL